MLIIFYCLYSPLTEELLIGLKDKDTVVRWSAAKGLVFCSVCLLYIFVVVAVAVVILHKFLSSADTPNSMDLQ